MLNLDPVTYRRHAMHGEDRAWVEKNCYIDIWIEVVHALGLEPRAMLGVTLALDFEGDQWTFFKPSHDELWELYGIDVQELNVWQPLLQHALEYLAAGKLISTEADAWWLPDTQGTDYRRQHTKTTIVIESLNPAARRMGYFHNAAYYALEGEDYDESFRPGLMPLFAEAVKIDRVVRREEDELRARARARARAWWQRRPATNPVARFAARFAADLPALSDAGLAHYHAWAFATVRQLGAAFELASALMGWLGEAAAAEEFGKISTAAKALILKAARAVNAKRALDASALMDEMAGAWQRGMDLFGR